MPEEKRNVRTLTIFLMKEGLTVADQVVNDKACKAPIDVAIAGTGIAKLYIKKTPPQRPKWAGLFEGELDAGMLDELKVPGVAAVLFLTVDGRGFALAFGQGGRFLLQDDVWEERFGLLAALNSVDPKSLRCVDVQSLDAIQSQSRIQSGQEASPDEFGLNVEQDMLKAIVGAPTDKALGNRMAGSDCLTVAVKMKLSDLPALLKSYRAKHDAPLKSADHEWVNNIAPVKSAGLIASLEAELEAKLAGGHLDGIWLAIPEIIDWSSVDGFIFSGGRSEMYPDITFPGFVKTLKGSAPTLKALRACRVHCCDGEFNLLRKSWPVFKCLYAEIDYKGAKYILNDAKWFCVAADFVAKTSADYAKIPRSALSLPKYTGGGEGVYNAAVAAAAPGQYALLDAKPIMHGGANGKVEVCDLFSVNRELIHVKHYSKSSVLSHLFAQGFVSGQLLQIDTEFRGKVSAALAPPFNSLIEAGSPPERGAFAVVYAIISESPGDELRLPFFSQVNLNNTAKVLRGHGYKVELLKVNWDSALATKKRPKKTAKAAPVAPVASRSA